MKHLILLLLLFATLPVSGQTVRYKTCTNCPDVSGPMTAPVNGFTYSATIQEMTPQNIASDFGNRLEGSRFHIGIDVSSQGGDADMGDHIYPIETGTVMLLHGTGYKYIQITGNQANSNRYGYGHIFFDDPASTTAGIRSGNFILKKMNKPANISVWNHYAIIYINGSTVNAIGTVAGTVTVSTLNNGLPIQVTTQVNNINVPIAPIGDSGGNFDAHIHLYNFQNNPTDDDFKSGYPGDFNDTNFRNPKNALQFVDHESPTYTVSHIASVLAYPGNLRSYFRVRAAIVGASGSGSPGYSQGVMNVESMQLFWKRSYEANSEYKLYKGPVLESKIVYGGRTGSIRYPSVGYPAHNTGDNSIDIARGAGLGTGNPTRTGIHAHAYRDSAYDDFFFSDFYTRIHKDDNYGGENARFASIPEQARYPDGLYNFYAKLTNVRNVNTDGPTKTIRIDNFKPYIKEVIVRANAEWGPLVYRGYWQWNGSQLVLYRETLADLHPSQTAWIKVVMSEPMPFEVPLAYQVGINIPSVDGTTYRGMTPVAGKGDQEFVITYNAFLSNGSRAINFNADGLESMSVSPKTLPIRQASNAWLPAANPGADQNHFFNTGLGTCPSPAPPGAKTGDCLTANFGSDVREAQPGTPVQFMSYSTGTAPIQYAWNFGTGATPATATTVGPHTVTYSSTGSKTVALTVTDITGSVTSTKSNYISVTNNPSAVDFSASRTTAMQPAVITFSPSFDGTVTSYSWSFPGGTPSSSTAQNPSVTYTGTGTYDVTLTINGVSQKIKTGYITITPAPPLVASLTHCDNFYFQNCNTNYKMNQNIFFQANVTGGTTPYLYSWSFGDGNSSPFPTSSNETGHSYFNPGTYTVTATITDNAGVVTTASVSVSPVTVIPFLDVGFTISDTYVTSTDGPVIFTDNSQSNVDLSNANYYWDFGTGAYPRFAYTKGPHSVCYDNWIPTKPIYYRVYEPSYYNLYDYAYGTVNVASGNVAQCADYVPQYKPVPGSASAGVSGTCLYPTPLYGIPNGDLEDFDCNVVSNPHNCPFSLSDPCFEGTIYASHGDPSLKRNSTNHSLRLWAHSVVDINNITGGTRVKSEGIFYQHPRNFQPGVKYTLTFFARIADEDLISCGTNCPGKVHAIDHLRISLTAGLEPTFDCQPDDGSIYRLPNYELSRFTLGSFDYTLSHNDFRCYEVYFYAPNGNFNQIWIYPEMELSLVPISPQWQTGERMSWMAIDKFSLRSASPESECPAELIVQHATPGNTIVADQRVTTMGVVTIGSGQTKTYKAGETITLAPGFTAAAGSTFTATQGICAEPGGRRLVDIPLVDIYRQEPEPIHNTWSLSDKEPALVSAEEDILEVFPNPARDRVEIRLKEVSSKQTKVSIYNAMGALVYENYMSTHTVIDVSLFSKGAYVVKLELAGRVITKQFVKH